MRDRVGHLVGVDLSPGMLALARAKILARAPALRPPDRRAISRTSSQATPAASADLCLAADVLIYVADLGPVLGEIGRVLRPGGLAAFTVQSHDGIGCDPRRGRPLRPRRRPYRRDSRAMPAWTS